MCFKAHKLGITYLSRELSRHAIFYQLHWANDNQAGRISEKGGICFSLGSVQSTAQKEVFGER